MVRMRDERIVCLSMEKKITVICESIGSVVTESRTRFVPIPISGVIVNVEELVGEKAVCLSLKESET